MSAIPGVPLSGGVRVLIAAKPVDFRNYAECMIMLSLRQSAEYPVVRQSLGLSSALKCSA